jgi:hypothetical protein
LRNSLQRGFELVKVPVLQGIMKLLMIGSCGLLWVYWPEIRAQHRGLLKFWTVAGFKPKKELRFAHVQGIRADPQPPAQELPTPWATSATPTTAKMATRNVGARCRRVSVARW